MGWYADNSGDRRFDSLAVWNELRDWSKYTQRLFDNSCRTHPAGKKQPNAWGLYDMHGNVWEWCQDWEGDYASGSVTDPTGPSSGADRVGRGGCWGDYSRGCRSADRGSRTPGDRDGGLGFRLARTH